MTKTARGFYAVTMVISLLFFACSFIFIVNREYSVHNEGYLYHFNHAKQATLVSEAYTYLHLATTTMKTEKVTHGYTVPWSKAPEYNIGLFFNSLKDLETKLDTSQSRPQEEILSEFHVAANALVVPQNIALVPYLEMAVACLVFSLLWLAYSYHQLSTDDTEQSGFSDQH